MTSGLCTILLVLFQTAGSTNVGPQREPAGVSFIELIANPERYNKHVVTVWGFLTIGKEKKHGTKAILYLHEEDANNALGNWILVIPSAEMIRNMEKLNEMYVRLTASFAAVPIAGQPGTANVLTDVQSCIVWSDPRHPIGTGEGPVLKPSQ